jgi:hypothetical protein
VTLVRPAVFEAIQRGDPAAARELMGPDGIRAASAIEGGDKLPAHRAQL